MRPPRQVVLTGDVTSELGLEVIRLLMRTSRGPQKDHLESIAGVTALTSRDRTALLVLDEGLLTVLDASDTNDIDTVRGRLLFLSSKTDERADIAVLRNTSFEHAVSVSGERYREKNRVEFVETLCSSWTLMLLAPFMHHVKGYSGSKANKEVAAIDLRDAAAAIVAVLLSAEPERHAQREYYLTGPSAFKVSDFFPDLKEKTTTQTNKENIKISNDVRRLTLRSPLSFSDHLSKRPQWRRRFRKLLPFEEIRKMARTLGLDTEEEFKDWLNNGNRALTFGPYFPAKPKEMYADEWRGWPDFLGARRDYEDAKRMVKNLGIKTQAQWWHFAEHHSDTLAELRVPVRPHKAYKQQFRGYDDWLGLSLPPLTVPSNLTNLTANSPHRSS